MGFPLGCQGGASTATLYRDCKSVHQKSKELQNNSSVYLGAGEKQEQMMFGKSLLLQLIMLTQDHTQAATADPMPSEDPRADPTPSGTLGNHLPLRPLRSPWMGTGKSPSLLERQFPHLQQ